MSQPSASRRPNILLVMTDQLRYPPADELAAYRREHCPGRSVYARTAFRSGTTIR
jgi:hypothetical protein